MVALSIEREVRARAGGVCEYCRFPEAAHAFPFQLDHIISLQNRGESGVENLALACPACNLHKGPNVGGIDPESGQLVRLYNPRSDEWEHHFRFAGATVLGLTAVGRVTVHMLAMNAPGRLQARQACIAAGLMLM